MPKPRPFNVMPVWAAFLAVALPFGVSAQGLEIEPILLDPAPGSDTDVVLAALPTSNTAPVLENRAGASRIASVASTGLPKPSLILGMIAAGEEEAFGIETLLPATVEELAFALDDLTARAALRDSDPDLFRQLVEEGHVDPDPDDLNRVLQVELQRMNCYRSGIDGAWGPGSRRSVSAYFDELDSVSWPDQAPTNELFRTILINGDVDCPTPVAAPAPRVTSTPTRTTRTTTTRQTTAPAPTRRVQPAPQPAPKAQQPKLRIGGSGVFR